MAGPESVAGRDQAGQPTRCMNCREPLESPIGCLHCHAIFADEQSLSHFDRMGLPTRFDLSDADIDRKYMAWSRELHPDFHAVNGRHDQQVSLRLSAALNDAYATLKNPFRRAEYLLHLLGGPTASQHRAMPEGFLESILDLRMEIEELRDGSGSDSLRKELLDRLRRERNADLAEVGNRFREIERKETSPSVEELSAIRERLNIVKYRDGLIRELLSDAP